MIISGIRTITLDKETIPESCPNCGKSFQLDMKLLQRYYHIFWIPMFPLGKTAETTCAHCKNVLAKKQFTEMLSARFNEMKSNSRLPLQTFIGTVLLIALFLWADQSNKADRKNNLKLLDNPLPGDIYELSSGLRHYTICKVANVKSDTVFVYMGKIEANKISGINDLKLLGDAAYETTPQAKTRTELKQMLESGTLRQIDRTNTKQ